MPEPFLHLGNICVVIQCIGRGRRAKGVRADLEPQPESVPPHKFIYPVWSNGIVEAPGAIIADGTEEGALYIGRVPCLVEIVVEQFLCACMQRQVASLASFTEHSKVRHAAP